jgi:lipopolysaccharide heptosyltransferase II
MLPGARWPSKCWPANRFGHIAAMLGRERALPSIVLGAPADTPLAEQIVNQSAGHAHDLTGRTGLRTLAAVLSLASAVVCCDSGPMHLAAALDRPTVAVFGPTDPRRTGPYSHRARVVRREMPCMPCLRRKCPLGHNDCMIDLGWNEVACYVMRQLPAPATASQTTPVAQSR